MKEFDDLKAAVDKCIDDVMKADTGNKAATVRIRKEMQRIKNLAQAVRVALLATPKK